MLSRTQCKQRPGNLNGDSRHIGGRYNEEKDEKGSCRNNSNFYCYLDPMYDASFGTPSGW